MAALAFVLVLFILPESHQPRPAARETAGLVRDVLRDALLSPIGLLLLLIFIMSFGMTNF
jgi:hypothetical protein